MPGRNIYCSYDPGRTGLPQNQAVHSRGGWLFSQESLTTEELSRALRACCPPSRWNQMTDGMWVSVFQVFKESFQNQKYLSGYMVKRPMVWLTM